MEENGHSRHIYAALVGVRMYINLMHGQSKVSTLSRLSQMSGGLVTTVFIHSNTTMSCYPWHRAGLHTENVWRKVKFQTFEGYYMYIHVYMYHRALLA